MKPIWYFLFGVWWVAGVFLLAAWWPFLASAVRRRFLGDRRPELVVALEELEKAEQRVAKVHSALSRWSEYYCTGLGIIESRVVRAFWRFAHRKGCNNANANNWVVARRELISTDVAPLTDKIYSRIVLHFPTYAAACSHVPLWEITEWDFRMKCRKCGRIHQRTMTHYQPL